MAQVILFALVLIQGTTLRAAAFDSGQSLFSRFFAVSIRWIYNGIPTFLFAVFAAPALIAHARRRNLWMCCAIGMATTFVTLTANAAFWQGAASYARDVPLDRSLNMVLRLISHSVWPQLISGAFAGLAAYRIITKRMINDQVSRL